MLAFSSVLNTPVDSITRSTPHSFQGQLRGLRSAKNLISLPLTNIELSVVLISTEGSRRPRMES